MAAAVRRSTTLSYSLCSGDVPKRNSNRPRRPKLTTCCRLADAGYEVEPFAGPTRDIAGGATSDALPPGTEQPRWPRRHWTMAAGRSLWKAIARLFPTDQQFIACVGKTIDEWYIEASTAASAGSGVSAEEAAAAMQERPARFANTSGTPQSITQINPPLFCANVWVLPIKCTGDSKHLVGDSEGDDGLTGQHCRGFLLQERLRKAKIPIARERAGAPMQDPKAIALWEKQRTAKL